MCQVIFGEFSLVDGGLIDVIQIMLSSLVLSQSVLEGEEGVGHESLLSAHYLQVLFNFDDGRLHSGQLTSAVLVLHLLLNQVVCQCQSQFLPICNIWLPTSLQLKSSSFTR